MVCPETAVVARVALHSVQFCDILCCQTVDLGKGLVQMACCQAKRGKSADEDSVQSSRLFHVDSTDLSAAARGELLACMAAFSGQDDEDDGCGETRSQLDATC